MNLIDNNVTKHGLPYNKNIALVIVGNILDYYDFLLFAHLGFIITPLFIPNLTSVESHLVSLLLFGVPFLIRPLGGYIFGRVSDLKGRAVALTQSIKWSAIATLGFVFLPIHAEGGWICTYFFVFFRLLQGLSLGGEYPTAGTYLMERYPDNSGLLSGVLCASGTIGSLAAFFFAWLAMQPGSPTWLWRFAFLLGGLCSLVSYFLRKQLANSLDKVSEKTAPRNVGGTNHQPASIIISIVFTLFIGMLVGLTTWIPMTYSNFYLTKMLNYPTSSGLLATFVALSSYVILTPIFGAASDRGSKMRFMSIWAFLTIPLSCFGFWLMINGQIIWGQICLIIPAASFGAPIHVVMNQFFPKKYRSRYLNTFFMLGLGLGGLGPSISGFVTNSLGWHFFPPILLSVVALITTIMFLIRYRNNSSN